MHTVTDSITGEVRVVNDTPRTDPQAFTVYVNDAKDWKEIHDYIIYENNLDNIPNRQISVVSELAFSPKRSVYSMSEDEADVLRNHPKVGFVTYSSMYNEIVLEQRKYEEKFAPCTEAFRFQDTLNSTKFYKNDAGFDQIPIDSKTEHISHWRKSMNVMAQDSNPEVLYNHDNIPQGTLDGVTFFGNDYPVGLGSTNPGIGITFTQWGLLRHGYKENPFKGGFPGTPTGSLANEVITDKDVSFSLTGKHVDIVIMDSGVIWNHPEFLLPGITTISRYTSTTDSEGNAYDWSTIDVKPYTRVRDILIDGQEDYGIDWAAEGLVPPGSGTLSSYSRPNVQSQSNFFLGGHGTHVASTAAGNVFGHAPEANIWSIACVDASSVGWAEPSDGFDYIKVWHKKKPINPVTGRKNPTIVNCSWGHRVFFRYDLDYTATFRGTSYTRDQLEADNNAAPAIYYIAEANAGSAYWKEFTAKKISGQASADELYEDPDCKDIILVMAAGNSGMRNGKQDLPLEHGGDGDYEDNKITSGSFYYLTAFGYDFDYNRPGTPAITGIGQPDAPIKVGNIDSIRQGLDVPGIPRSNSSGNFGQERISFSSNRGPAVDILAAGTNIWGSDKSGNPPSVYRDPRRPVFDTSLPDSDFTRRANKFSCSQKTGTSMAAPQVTGVIAQKLQADPSMNRIDVRNWLMSEGSVMVDKEEFWGGKTDGGSTSDRYTPEDAVGINSVNYWSYLYSLRGSESRVLFNPYANNSKASIKGVNISGVSITQL